MASTLLRFALFVMGSECPEVRSLVMIVSKPPTLLRVVPRGVTRSQFTDTIRSGIPPQGILLDPRFMPWNRFTQMTDDELDAIWSYLQSLPAK